MFWQHKALYSSITIRPLLHAYGQLLQIGYNMVLLKHPLPIAFPADLVNTSMFSRKVCHANRKGMWGGFGSQRHQCTPYPIPYFPSCHSTLLFSLWTYTSKMAAISLKKSISDLVAYWERISRQYFYLPPAGSLLPSSFLLDAHNL